MSNEFFVNIFYTHISDGVVTQIYWLANNATISTRATRFRIAPNQTSAICHCSVWYALIIAHIYGIVNTKNSIFQCLLKLHNRMPWNNICILHIVQKYWTITVMWYDLCWLACLYTIIGDKNDLQKVGMIQSRTILHWYAGDTCRIRSCR